MAKRTRRASPGRVLVEQQQGGFNVASYVQIAFIPLLTGVVILVGFYFTTNSTLNRYGEDIKTLKITVDTKVEADTAARTKIREDFLTSQIKTADGIAKLDTRLAVAETNQKTQLETLNKISDTLSKISTLATVGSAAAGSKR